MSYLIRSEIYGQHEKVVDRFVVAWVISIPITAAIDASAMRLSAFFDDRLRIQAKMNFLVGMKGKPNWKAAAVEAEQEAGVLGEINRNPLARIDIGSECTLLLINLAHIGGEHYLLKLTAIIAKEVIHAHC